MSDDDKNAELIAKLRSRCDPKIVFSDVVAGCAADLIEQQADRITELESALASERAALEEAHKTWAYMLEGEEDRAETYKKGWQEGKARELALLAVIESVKKTYHASRGIQGDLVQYLDTLLSQVDSSALDERLAEVWDEAIQAFGQNMLKPLRYDMTREPVTNIYRKNGATGE